jgi:hypothetical protein
MTEKAIGALISMSPSAMPRSRIHDVPTTSKAAFTAPIRADCAESAPITAARNGWQRSMVQ